MLVQNPNAKPKPQELIENILKQAAEGGRGGFPSESDDDEEDEHGASSSKKPSYFQGSGFTLGSDSVASRQVGESLAKSTTTAEESGEAEGGVVTRELTFWRNGFSIGDGPLMQYDDPAHQAILKDIQSGRAPLSLFGLKVGQRADVRVAHRMQDDYVAPKPVLKAFSGQGQRLGSHIPGESLAKAASSASSTSAVTTGSTAAQLNVDESKPVTSIQIRLADGTRLVSKFNTTHTVADVRQFILHSRPSNAAAPFVLQTTFPVRTLEDDKATLESAGLLNTVVVQKYV